MLVNANVAPFASNFYGSLFGALLQNANDTFADIDPFRNLAQIGYNQLNSSLSSRRQWKYYKKQAELDHQYNLQTMDRAAEIARDQYDYEYEMESPAQRVMQLRQAGLNKGLMYSNGVAGMQGSVGSGAPATSRGTMPNTKDSFNKPTSSPLGSALSALSQNKVNESIVLANNSTAEKQSAEASKTRVETLISQKNLILKDLEIERARIDNARSDKERQFFEDSYYRKLNQLDALNDKIEAETKTEQFKAQNYDSATKLNEQKSLTEVKYREELQSRIKLNVAQSNQLDNLARKYELDNEYREEVNRIFKKYGIDTSQGGTFGLFERLSVVPLKLLEDILKSLGVDYNPY